MSNTSEFSTSDGLWGLPKQPLPAATSLIGPVCVTIWLFTTIFLSVVLYIFCCSRSRKAWPEFKSIMWAGIPLSAYFLSATVDRWLHYDAVAVPYGYIIIYPFFEAFRVLSTVIYLWGTYHLVWRDLEERFGDAAGKWWLAAKLSIFIVGLVSLYYVVLYMTLAFVWVFFLSLNSIADIATKRTSFEISMVVFNFLFGLLTVAAAWATYFEKGVKQDGKVRKSPMVLLAATFVLFARSFAELIIMAMINGKKYTRQSTSLYTDLIFGLLTTLYLILMCVMAWLSRRELDIGSPQARDLQCNIRRKIIEVLQTETDGDRKIARAFVEVLRDVRQNKLQEVFNNSGLSREACGAIADECIQDLNTKFGAWDPKQGRYAQSTIAPSRNSRLSSLKPWSRNSSKSRLNLSSTETSQTAAGSFNGATSSNATSSMSKRSQQRLGGRRSHTPSVLSTHPETHEMGRISQQQGIPPPNPGQVAPAGGRLGSDYRSTSGPAASILSPGPFSLDHRSAASPNVNFPASLPSGESANRTMMSSEPSISGRDPAAFAASPTGIRTASSPSSFIGRAASSFAPPPPARQPMSLASRSIARSPVPFLSGRQTQPGAHYPPMPTALPPGPP